MKPGAQGALPDGAHRVRAATLFGRNLVVTAGAGTGKTALLVERALNLIAGEGLDVSALAAITFTEKAAAELRQRMATGLDDLRRLAAAGAEPSRLSGATEAERAFRWLASSKELPLETIARRCRAALSELDAAHITTIHAFCSEILRRYPGEAGVDPGFVVDEGEQFQSLFDEEWERFLLEELGQAASRVPLWEKVLLQPESLAAVRELARSLARFGIPREAIVPEIGYRPAPRAALLGEEIRRARDEAFSILAHTSGMNPNMQDFLAASAELLTAYLDEGAGALSTAASPVPLPDYVAKSVPSPGKNLSGAGAAEVAAAAKLAQGFVKRIVKIDEDSVSALVEAAVPLAARARERLLASGCVSFDALLSLTRDLLASNAGVRRELAARYETILVDEFQDTDPLQYEILFLLTGREGGGPDPWAMEPAPGRLFIVGDPKQSIYRFRGADMEAYRRAVDRVLDGGGEQLTLSASFRSPSGITDPLNELFKGWIGPRAAGEEAFEPVYEEIVSARGGDAAGPRVEIWTVDSPGAAAGRRRGEGEAIASWIGRNLGRQDATGSTLRYKDVAILLRALTNADLYAQALRRAGIPYVVEGGRGFYERREVSDLIAFLRAAANPADAASLLAVLRSPLGAAPDSELARYAAAGGRLDRGVKNEVNLAAYPNIQRTFTLLRSFRDGMTGRPVDEIIRSVFTRTPLLALHASCFEGPQRVANMRKLVARGEDLARRGLSLEETLRFIESEYQDERAEGESPLADETVDAVRILSVHKAKGLEYPVVFTPDVGRAAVQLDARATGAAWVTKDGTGYLAVCLPAGKTNLAWAYLLERGRRHDAAEEKRVLYVATTRARERLILINSSLERKAPWRDALAALGYAVDGGAPPPEGPLDSGRVSHFVVRVDGSSRREEGGTLATGWVEAADGFRKTARSAAKSARAPIRRPSGEHDEKAAGVSGRPDDDEPGFTVYKKRPKPGVARLAGEIVHSVLERCPFGQWDRMAALLDEEAARRSEGAAAAEGDLARRARTEAEEILAAFRGSPLSSRLEGVEVLGRETPVLFRTEEESGAVTWLGSCDLIYRDRDGGIVVADYKTDKLQESPAAHAGKYEDQISLYVRAVRRALPGERVRGEILFVRTGDSVPFDVSE